MIHSSSEKVFRSHEGVSTTVGLGSRTSGYTSGFSHKEKLMTVRFSRRKLELDRARAKEEKEVKRRAQWYSGWELRRLEEVAMPNWSELLRQGMTRKLSCSTPWENVSPFVKRIIKDTSTYNGTSETTIHPPKNSTNIPKFRFQLKGKSDRKIISKCPKDGTCWIATTHDSAIQLAFGMMDLLRDGGFRLTKSISNCKQVLLAIPIERRAASNLNCGLKTLIILFVAPLKNHEMF